MSAPREDGTELRAQVIATARAMTSAGLAVNQSGNVSVRSMRGRRGGFLVTPSGLPYDELAPDDIVFVADDGSPIGRNQPSTEWRFHAAIYAQRTDIDAIVHTHSPNATALACHELSIPAFHYMVAAAGGNDVRCAAYATFGTQELADHAIAALADRRACLLAHHGVIACGSDLDHAFGLAAEIENLARMYIAARALGQPPLLGEEEMGRVIEKFRHYGRRRGP